MSELTEKIAKFLVENEPAAGETMDVEDTAAEIASMIEAERKPDTITVQEAVERLVGYFDKWFVHAIYSKKYGVWDVVTHTMDEGKPPDWVNAIINGNNSPAAVKVGLEDLFVTILTESEK